MPKTFFSVNGPHLMTNNNQRGLKINIHKRFNLNSIPFVVKIEESVKSSKKRFLHAEVLFKVLESQNTS